MFMGWGTKLWAALSFTLAASDLPFLQQSILSNGTAFPLSIRVLSHNIRYATTAPFQGEELWSVRKSYILNELRFNTAQNPGAFICCQEVLKMQLDDLLTGLNDVQNNWTYIGVGCDDGKEAGEYSPIFYRPDVWQLLNSTTVWLSETPKVPSKGWDAASVRILTTGKFLHIESQTQILALNTHLDDQGIISRLESAKLIAERAQVLSDIGGDKSVPVFLAGDFNSEPSQEAYGYITQNGTFSDTFDLVPVVEHYGDNTTFTGFGFEDEPPKRIDFVFTRYKGNDPLSTPWEVLDYAVLPNRFDDGVFSSDHRAVVANMILKGY